ncbi:YbgA family protein [Marinicellulosiphila megalodicopiae]|uniref:YbgA family protein n=1 Tax=Marinicellulosiphila megalodicopiae TaxID=2724896 RepID=UPI003BB1A8ED
MKKFNIAISSCLIGNKVRYDGGSKTFKWATTVLSEYAQFHPYCPEMEIGLPAPRKTIRLIDVNNQIQLKTNAESDDDLSGKMKDLFEKTQNNFKDKDGIIVTVNSPSCGMERVKLYGENGMLIHKNSVGVFTNELMQKYPLIPIEENGRLQDKAILQNFLERLFAYKNFKQDVLEDPKPAKLIKFHSQYKYQIMAHSNVAYKQLGQLTAKVSKDSTDDYYEYFAIFMNAMKIIPTAGQHCNVLNHIQGYFKNDLDKDEKQEMCSLIEQYQNDIIDILAPITLLIHFCRKYPNEYLAQQSYFKPYNPLLLKMP